MLNKGDVFDGKSKQYYDDRVNTLEEIHNMREKIFQNSELDFSNCDEYDVNLISS